MRMIKCATALIAAAGLLAIAGTGLAADPTQADFDACNKEAQSRASSPAASPGTSGSGASSSSPSVSGGTSGSSGGASGTMSGGPSGSAGSGTSGSVSGSASPSSDAEAALKGIASSGQSDPAYQQAYRDCMKRRGF